METTESTFVPALIAPDFDSFVVRQAIAGFLAGYGETTGRHTVSICGSGCAGAPRTPRIRRHGRVASGVQIAMRDETYGTTETAFGRRTVSGPVHLRRCKWRSSISAALKERFCCSSQSGAASPRSISNRVLS